MMDENDRYQEYFDYFSDQLSMDLLKKDYPYDSEMLDNILELIVETVCTKRPLIRIGAEERPAEIVRSRFMKLNAEHIRSVMDKRKMKKLLILNLPYFLVGLFATNLGEAWRLAEGADSSAKIVLLLKRMKGVILDSC